METEKVMSGLRQALEDYRQDLEACERRLKPTDGLLGFGHSLKDDPCHERLDERLKEAVRGICALPPPPEAAEEAVRFLLLSSDPSAWPLAAQWMLRVAERHAIPLIPYLPSGAAQEILRQYTARYRPWDRLPAQKEVCKALKNRGG